MGRAKVEETDARAIAMRLKDFAELRYDSWEGFWKEIGFSRTTADSWRGSSPSVPDPRSLLILARKTNINLNWLLLHEGDMLRANRDATTPYGHMLSLLETELRMSEEATDDEADQAWAKMVVYQTERSGFDAILALAVEGVRPLYRGFLLEQRVLDLASRMFGPWAEAWQEGEDVDVEKMRRRIDEYSQQMSHLIEEMVGNRIALSGKTYTRGSGG